MDTNTGEIKILTEEDVKRELEKVTPLKASSAKELATKMNVDDFMAKFMPDMVPLKSLPKKNCKKCHGRGYLGRNVLTNKYVPCSCCL